MNESPISRERFGLRIKIIGAMLAALVLVLAVVGVTVFVQMGKELKDSLRARGKGLARNLAAESVVDLMYEQHRTEQARIEQRLLDDEAVSYVLVLRRARKGETGVGRLPYVVFAQAFRGGKAPVPVEQLAALHLGNPLQEIDHPDFLGFTQEVRPSSSLAATDPSEGEESGNDEELLLDEAGDGDTDAPAPAKEGTGSGKGEAPVDAAVQKTAAAPPGGGADGELGYVCLGLSTQRLEAQKGSLVRQMSIAILVGILLFGGAIYLASRGLYRRLLYMIEVAMRASKGDLTRTIRDTGHDEIGLMAEALNRITGNLNIMVGKIVVASKSLGEAVEQISSATEEVVRGAEYQVAAVDETSSAVAQMMISLRGIAENVETLSGSAEESSSSILEMAATNDEVADNIHQLAASVEQTTSSIEQMAAAIKEVARSVEDLSTASEQTSASMREMDISIGQVEQNANETAVLSEEVRRDAERGSEAVQKTMQGISRISESTQGVFATMEALGKKAQAIGQVLTVIDDVAEQTNLLALNAAIIAAQAGEHGKGFAVVADEIKDLAERTASSTSEIANLIRSVQQETKNVIEAMQRGLRDVDEGVHLSNEAEQALQKILESATKSTAMVRAIARATVEQARGSKEVTDAIARIAETVQQIASSTAQQAKGSEQIMSSAERMKIITQHVHASSQEQARGSKQITKAIENISEMVHHLNRAQKEQSRGAEQVMKAVERIKEVAEHHSDSMNRMKTVVDRVAEQADTLRGEMDRFKL